MHGIYPKIPSSHIDIVTCTSCMISVYSIPSCTRRPENTFNAQDIPKDIHRSLTNSPKRISSCHWFQSSRLETCLVGWLHPERKLQNVQKFHIATVSPNKIGVWWQNMLGSISWHGTWAKNHRSSNGAICSACRNKTGSARKLWRAPDYQTPPHRGRQTREFRQRHPGCETKRSN